MMVIEIGDWIGVKDGDDRARAIYLRHYSARKNGATFRGNKNWDRFASQGEHIILMTPACDALFIWVRQRYRLDNQEGVNCSVFRNEGALLSSVLILEAEVLAWRRWPGERLFTYVDPTKIISTNPGYCFIQAGWRRCGFSKKGLIILEKQTNSGHTAKGE